MKQKKSENRDAMSAGELLGKLKQNYAGAGTSTRETNKAASQLADAADDDLDIAALLKQYLPDADGPSPSADESDEFELIPDEDIAVKGPAVEESVAASPAGDELDDLVVKGPDFASAAVGPAVDEQDDLVVEEPDLSPVEAGLALDEPDDSGEALASDEEVLAEEAEMPSVDRPSTRPGAHFASLLDTLGDEPLAAAEPAVDSDDFLADPMADCGADQTPKVKKYVYHFRPSTRNGQTVKVQETVTPVESPKPQNENTDSYFTGRSKPGFALDDEPVIPDASAFIDLIPPLQPDEPKKSMDTEPERGSAAEAIPETMEPVAPVGLETVEDNATAAGGEEQSSTTRILI